MRFALLGEHPDGIDLAAALIDTRQHQCVAVSGRVDQATLDRLGRPQPISDVEDILADPAVEAVIVASSPALRGEQLRRALQSERHVMCVHPAGEKPDIAYEAALIQNDTRVLLFPILPEALHPAIARLREFIDRGRDDTRSPIGVFQLLLFERHSHGEVLDAGHEGQEPAVPGWDILRRLGGEIIEVSSFTDGEELALHQVVLLAGRFDQGGLFQVTLVPRQPAGRWRLVVIGTTGQAELLWPEGWNGPAQLQWQENGQRREEHWPGWNPWPAVVAAFEGMNGSAPLTWQDEVRALELDDAARRSVERRRVNLMEYQEASEEVGFKGTMTLVGCAMLWAVLLLLIGANWVPRLRWLILPLLVVFIGLQLLRYLIPAKDEQPRSSEGEK